MNEQTRKQIQKLLDQMQQNVTTIEQLQSEEQEKFDNLSEAAQASERGQSISDAADRLQEAVDNLQEVINSLEEAMAL